MLSFHILMAASMKTDVFWVLVPWRCRQQALLKRRWTSTTLHGATTHKTAFSRKKSVQRRAHKSLRNESEAKVLIPTAPNTNYCITYGTTKTNNSTANAPPKQTHSPTAACAYKNPVGQSQDHMECHNFRYVPTSSMIPLICSPYV
jgi:hypothetical protein